MGRMVGDQPDLQYKEHWFPTRASSERFILMQVEFSICFSAEKGQPGMAEVAWSSGDVDRAMSVVPAYIPPKVKRLMRRLLQPWPAGRYTDAYHRSGGILNLFTPPWDERQDEVWASMLAGWEAQVFTGVEAREAALRRLEQQWNTTPHPFFAGLTPAQVMIGGGPEEAQLADDFLEHLTRMYDGQGFESGGEALIKTLILLRGWQSQPRKKGKTPLEIIAAERNELLARRSRALAQRNIS
jgi:hypothetical protein